MSEFHLVLVTVRWRGVKAKGRRPFQFYVWQPVTTWTATVGS